MRRLLFADGRCYSWRWQRNASHASCTLLLFPAARDLPALPLLVALSPYLLVLGQEQHGPLPRRRSLPGEEVAAELLAGILTVLGELLGHLHIYSVAG